MNDKNRMVLKNFSIGLPKQMTYGDDKEMNTGICKEAVEGAFLTTEGFRGDGVADLRFHGGMDRAVCVYPYEHYSIAVMAFGYAVMIKVNPVFQSLWDKWKNDLLRKK